MLKRLQNLAAHLLRIRRASKLANAGEKLYYEKDFGGAVRALTEAKELVGIPDEKSSWFGATSTIRIHALAFLAYAAARLGDRPLALSTIAEVRPMLDWLNEHASRAIQQEFWRTWQQWAREYAA